MSVLWKGTVAGVETIGIGIEAGNIERMMNGQPMVIRGDRLGIPFNIVIHYGRSPAEIMDEMKAAGADLPKPQNYTGDDHV